MDNGFIAYHPRVPVIGVFPLVKSDAVNHSLPLETMSLALHALLYRHKFH